MAHTSSAVGQDRRARGGVLLVRDRRAQTGVMLHEHLVAVPHQLVHACGGDGHPELVVLDLAGDTDLHVDHGPCMRGDVGVSSGRIRGRRHVRPAAALHGRPKSNEGRLTVQPYNVASSPRDIAIFVGCGGCPGVPLGCPDPAAVRRPPRPAARRRPAAAPPPRAAAGPRPDRRAGARISASPSSTTPSAGYR